MTTTNATSIDLETKVKTQLSIHLKYRIPAQTVSGTTTAALGKYKNIIYSTLSKKNQFYRAKFDVKLVCNGPLNLVGNSKNVGEFFKSLSSKDGVRQIPSVHVTRHAVVSGHGLKKFTSYYKSQPKDDSKDPLPTPVPESLDRTGEPSPSKSPTPSGTDTLSPSPQPDGPTAKPSTTPSPSPSGIWNRHFDARAQDCKQCFAYKNEYLQECHNSFQKCSVLQAKGPGVNVKKLQTEIYESFLVLKEAEKDLTKIYCRGFWEMLVKNHESASSKGLCRVGALQSEVIALGIAYFLNRDIANVLGENKGKKDTHVDGILTKRIGKKESVTKIAKDAISFRDSSFFRTKYKFKNLTFFRPRSFLLYLRSSTLKFPNTHSKYRTAVDDTTSYLGERDAYSSSVSTMVPAVVHKDGSDDAIFLLLESVKDEKKEKIQKELEKFSKTNDVSKYVQGVLHIISKKGSTHSAISGVLKKTGK